MKAKFSLPNFSLGYAFRKTSDILNVVGNIALLQNVFRELKHTKTGGAIMHSPSLNPLIRKQEADLKRPSSASFAKTSDCRPGSYLLLWSKKEGLRIVSNDHASL